MKELYFFDETKKQMMFKELSGNALKVIAIVAMTIDHLAWVGIETYEQAETPTQIFLHLRLELCRPAGHTHDRPEPGLLPQADALDLLPHEFADKDTKK